MDEANNWSSHLKDKAQNKIEIVVIKKNVKSRKFNIFIWKSQEDKDLITGIPEREKIEKGEEK